MKKKDKAAKLADAVDNAVFQAWTRKFNKLPPHVQMLVLAEVMDDSAKRCEGNVLLEETWVHQTFRGMAEKLKEVGQRAKVQWEMEEWRAAQRASSHRSEA